MNLPLALDAELTIYTVAATRERLLAALQADEPGDATTVVLDASAVTDVDGAGVQLLLSLSRSLSDRQRRLALSGPSAPLREACGRLGLADLLATEDRA